ncbi:Alpha/beta fold hydrolase [[Mycoplasma] cavipharyngis]
MQQDTNLTINQEFNNSVVNSSNLVNLDTYFHGQKAYDMKNFFEIRGQILFLPDLISNYVVHEKFAKKITYYEYRAINYPGHGNSLVQPNLQFEGIVNLVCEYIKENNLDELTIIGHGFGALVAAAVAAQMKGNINKLIFVSPLTLASFRSVNDYKRLVLPLDLQSLCLSQSYKFANYQELVQYNDYQKDLVSELNYLIRNKANFENLYEEVYNIGFLHQVEEKYYQAIGDIPLLLILGANSKFTAVNEDVEFFDNNFLKVKSLIMKNAGYLPFLEQPGRYYLNVVNFLNDDQYTYPKPEKNRTFTDDQLLNEANLLESDLDHNQKKQLGFWRRLLQKIFKLK